MEIMNIMRWIRKGISLSLVPMLIVTYSMATLAMPGKPLGEIIVAANTSPDGASVTVNGEPAKSGRTVFSSSTIATPETMGVTINLGKAGKLELGPNTIFMLSAEGDAIGGDLTSGSVTVLSAAQSVGIKTLSGGLVSLNAGETARATSAVVARDYVDKTTGKCIDDDNDGKLECHEGLPPWALVAIIGGIVGAVIIAAVVSRDDDNVVISPIR